MVSAMFYCSSQRSHYLCCRVKHFRVQTKEELHDALVKSNMEQVDCVVEVDNSIDSNANFHRFISKLNFFYLFFLQPCSPSCLYISTSSAGS